MSIRIADRVPEPPIKLMVVIGSVRPGRIGLSVALWVHEHITNRGGFEIDFVDLAELNLPMVDEHRLPKAQQYTRRHTSAWSARVEQADAFLFVSPEINSSFSPALKNALDFLFHEWSRKPVGLVSYGGRGGGAFGSAALRPVLSELELVVASGHVDIHQASSQVEDGFFLPEGEQAVRLDALLDELGALAPALRSMRESALVAG
ncbi:NADPH-dependent FMN reductase [Mycetocola sp.]|jgi:NAD(P)H-dependent FMN reductase|uniref:NADPH-dependent FMN reductase n=1 Tax=Mycetocola sp. TaxID=1871042 RepID=UPI00262CD2A8|nr:NAD(P)H-dependent oxidoreductase [Mycetocola sp.]MCU1419965.1 NAD(P)H-dependent reductase [Mycetocola sp.]MCU1560905.1 NAD(P)H-dependent reductase [Mycetocola sp.]